jgi:hypothetical protein
MSSLTLLLAILALQAVAVTLLALLVAKRATCTAAPAADPERDVVFAPGGPRHRDSVHEVRPDEAFARDAAATFHHVRHVSARELDRRPQLPPGFVITPGGPRHQSHVHRVEPGHAVLGGRRGLRILNTATSLARELPAAEGDANLVSALGSGWITYAYWNNGTGSSITSLRTTWTVPPAPRESDNQVIFLFNGIQNYGANFGILQPVLQWGTSAAGGGPSWKVASWYVASQGTALHSPLVDVNPGDTLVGVMTLEGVNHVPNAPTTFDYHCVFEGLPGTSLHVRNIAELLWCNQTLEAYGVTRCDNYPDTPSTAMKAIALQTGTVNPSVSWTPVDAVTDCGQHTVVVNNSSTDGEVDLFYTSLSSPP